MAIYETLIHRPASTRISRVLQGKMLSGVLNISPLVFLTATMLSLLYHFHLFLIRDIKLKDFLCPTPFSSDPPALPMPLFTSNSWTHLYFFMFVCLFICICSGTCRGQKRILDLLKLELQAALESPDMTAGN